MNPTISKLVDDASDMEKRIAELEAALAEYRALYRWFGQDDMTDGRFVTEFERVYLADKCRAMKVEIAKSGLEFMLHDFGARGVSSSERDLAEL